MLEEQVNIQNDADSPGTKSLCDEQEGAKYIEAQGLENEA